uniref:Uncharacterized protein n=1 Tax=Rhizophora mucronata TaxID=61149 RepID=A0A2P2QWD6_RHIMU
MIASWAVMRFLLVECKHAHRNSRKEVMNDLSRCINVANVVSVVKSKLSHSMHTLRIQ